MRHLLRTARRARLSTDGGFTLVELMVAMVIIAIVVTSLLTLFVSTLGSTVAGKQRQSASALATQNLERLRALPYDVVRAGVRSTDLAGDPNVVAAGGPRLVIDGVDEQLVTSTTQNQDPLFPHRRTLTQDGQTYTVSVYVTEGTTALPSYQLTSVVEWAKAGSATPQVLVQRSVTYASEGCLSLSNRPFSGPCQASFSAVAGVTSGRITVTNPTDSTAAIAGTDGSLLALDLPGLSASTAVEQTVTTSADSRTFGASRRTASGDVSTGGLPAAVAADTDPSSTANTSSSAVTAPQTATTLTLAGPAGVLRARPSTGDSGQASTEVSGSAAGCVWANGTPVASTQPCATSAVTSSGSPAQILYDIATPVTLLGGVRPAVLASVAPPTTATRAAAGRLTASANGLCPATSGDGCAVASAQRSLGVVTVGGLPELQRSNDALTPGFPDGGSVVLLNGFAEAASTESGNGALAPTYSRSGTISFWNGTGYTNLGLASLGAGATHDAAPVTGRYRNGLGDEITVTADATLRVGALVSERVNVLPCDETTVAGNCTSRSTGASALSVQVDYVVEQTTVAGTVELTRFAVVADLGSVTATSYYRGAPDA